MKKSSYREMLRDRCPDVIDYALKWQKAKEKWIDHAYNYFVKLYGDEIDKDNKIKRSAKDNKRHVINLLLGIKKGKAREFDFSKSIDWDNLTEEDTAYWKRVASWVNWFRTNYAYIENTYNISKKVGKNEVDIQVEIIHSYLMWLMPNETHSKEEKQAKYDYVNKFVDYLIECINGKI